MKYTVFELTASSGITKAQKTEFFKLYTQLSRKIKNFVGRKKDSDLVQENFEKLLESMRALNKL